MNGDNPLVSLKIRPELSAISISPTQRAMIPAMAMQSDTASPALSRAAYVTSFIFPLMAPKRMPTMIIAAHI